MTRPEISDETAIVEIVYTWPDGREEVRYRAAENSERALDLIGQVADLQAKHVADCPYSWRVIRSALSRQGQADRKCGTCGDDPRGLKVYGRVGEGVLYYKPCPDCAQKASTGEAVGDVNCESALLSKLARLKRYDHPKFSDGSFCTSLFGERGAVGRYVLFQDVVDAYWMTPATPSLVSADAQGVDMVTNCETAEWLLRQAGQLSVAEGLRAVITYLQRSPSPDAAQIVERLRKLLFSEPMSEDGADVGALMDAIAYLTSHSKPDAAQLNALDLENDQLEEENAKLREALKDAKATQSSDELREAMRKYTSHLPGCDALRWDSFGNEERCTCGLTKLLEDAAGAGG